MPTRAKPAAKATAPASARGPEEALVTIARRTYDLMLSDAKSKARISVREIGQLGVGYHFSATLDAYIRKAKKETRIASRVFSIPLVRTLLAESGNVVELRNKEHLEQYFLRNEWNPEIPRSVFPELPESTTPKKSAEPAKPAPEPEPTPEPEVTTEPSAATETSADEGPSTTEEPKALHSVPAPTPTPEITLPEVPAGSLPGDPLPALVAYIEALRTSFGALSAELRDAQEAKAEAERARIAAEEKVSNFQALESEVVALRTEKDELIASFGTVENGLREQIEEARAAASRTGDLDVKIELVTEAVRDATSGKRGPLAALAAIEEVISS